MSEHELCDMAGNVREWVPDVYHENHYGVPQNRSARKGMEGSTRVLREGGFDTTFCLRTNDRAAAGVLEKDLLTPQD